MKSVQRGRALKTLPMHKAADLVCDRKPARMYLVRGEIWPRICPELYIVEDRSWW